MFSKLRKNLQKTLFSAVELVINMMKEVEDRESAMEIMKEESEMGGVDMLTKVMELKQMLVHAKEANDMVLGSLTMIIINSRILKLLLFIGFTENFWLIAWL